MVYFGQKKRDYERDYYAKNKELILQRRNRQIWCNVCQCYFKGIANRGHHMRTKKHEKNLCIE